MPRWSNIVSFGACLGSIHFVSEVGNLFFRRRKRIPCIVD
jgi:hypothetical protein